MITNNQPVELKPETPEVASTDQGKKGQLLKPYVPIVFPTNIENYEMSKLKRPEYFKDVPFVEELAKKEIAE